MLAKNEFIQAIDLQDFDQAAQVLDQGIGIPEHGQPYDYSALFDQLIRNKAYALLIQLVEKEQIEKDFYLLDTLENSLASVLIKNKNPDPASIQTLQQVLRISENINDEIHGQTLLSYALENIAHPNIIQALIDIGIRTDFRNNAEENLIQIAIKKYGIPKDWLLTYLDILISNGVDPNETNVVDQTALHVAIDRNKPELLDYLMQHGADPNQQDSKGISAYFQIVVDKAEFEWYQTLSQHAGMNFEQRNQRGELALHEYLRMMQNYQEDQPELLIQMLEDGASLDTRSLHYDQAKTGWEWIAERKAELIKKVLDKTGKDVNEQNDEGNTLLHLVCQLDCNHDQNAAKETYKKVKMLIDAGAEVSIINHQEKTAMDLAATNNLKAKTVELLLLTQQKERNS